MKISTVRHHYILGFLIHYMEVLPFNGLWNNPDPVALLDNRGNLLSEIVKCEDSIHIKEYGLDIDFEEFKKILQNPNSMMIDLVKASKNIIKFSNDEYAVAKFAKEHRLKYGFVYGENEQFYFIVNKTYPCTLDSGIFIDPNNPFF